MSGKMIKQISSNQVENHKQGLCAWEPEGNVSFDLFDCGIQNIEKNSSNNDQDNGGITQKGQEPLVIEVRQLKEIQQLSFPMKTLTDNSQSLILARPKDIAETPKASRIIASNSDIITQSAKKYPKDNIIALSKVELVPRNQEKTMNPFQISSRELSPIVSRKLVGFNDQKILTETISSQVQDAIIISSMLLPQSQKNQENIKQFSSLKNPILHKNNQIPKYPPNKILKTQTLIDFSKSTKLAKFDIGSYSDIFQLQKHKQLKSLKLKSPYNQPAKDIRLQVKDNKEVQKLVFEMQPSKSALALVKDKIRSSMKKPSLNYCLTSDKNQHSLDQSFSHLPSAMILSNYYQFQVEKRSKSLLKQQFLSIEGDSGFIKSKSIIVPNKKDDKLNAKVSTYFSKQRTKHFRALSLQNEAVTNSCMQTQTNFNDICEDVVTTDTIPDKQIQPPTQNVNLPQKTYKPIRSISCDQQQQNGILQFPKLILHSNHVSPITSRGSHESLLLRQIVASETINHIKDHKSTISSLSLNPSTRKTITIFPNNSHEFHRKQLIAMPQKIKV